MTAQRTRGGAQFSPARRSEPRPRGGDETTKQGGSRKWIPPSYACRRTLTTCALRCMSVLRSLQRRFGMGHPKYGVTSWERTPTGTSRFTKLRNLASSLFPPPFLPPSPLFPVWRQRARREHSGALFGRQGQREFSGQGRLSQICRRSSSPLRSRVLVAIHQGGQTGGARADCESSRGGPCLKQRAWSSSLFLPSPLPPSLRPSP